MTTKAIVASPPSPTAARLPLLAFGAAWAMIGASLLVYWRGWSYHVPIGYGADLPALLSTDLFAASASGMGLLVTRQRRRSAVGWLLLVLGAATAAIVLAVYADAVLAGWTGASTLGPSGWIAGAGLQPVIGGLTGLLMFVYPDGRLPSRSWRPAVGILIVGTAVRFVETGLAAPTVPYLPTLKNTYAVVDPSGWPVLAEIVGAAGPHAGLLPLLLGMGLGAASLVVRYRAASPEAREQIRWFMVAGTLVAATLLPLAHLFVFVSPSAGRGQDLWVAFFVCASLFPAAIWLAITRHRLYDIDRLVNRAFVHGTSIAVLAGVFTASIALSQRAFVQLTGETSDLAIVLTTLIAAAAYTPVRRRLERLADRLFRYEEPRLGAFSQSVHEMLAMLDPEETARRLLAEAMAEVHASCGWIELDGRLAALGQLDTEGPDGVMRPCPPAVSIPVGSTAGPVGRLMIGSRVGGGVYHDRDVRVLEEVAGLVGRAFELRPEPGTRQARPTRGRRSRVRRSTVVALGEPLAI
jgi:hypothetical protein